jgi:transcriptional regulator with XRE-family HTH domain
MEKNDLSIFYIKTSRDLGVALRRMRKNKGYTQHQVAGMVNMRQSTVSDVENGRGTLESLFKVIQALQINLTLSTGEVFDKKKRKAQELIDLL